MVPARRFWGSSRMRRLLPTARSSSSRRTAAFIALPTGLPPWRMAVSGLSALPLSPNFRRLP